MTISATVTKDPAVGASFAFLAEVLSGYGPRDFSIRAWDGTVWEPDAGQSARFTLVLQHSGSVRKMFWPPRSYTLGEAYIFDDIDIEGDIHAFFAVVSYLYEMRLGLRQRLRWLKRLLTLPGGERTRSWRSAAQLSGSVHSRERDREAVS
jgi:cyclopropane-fatty-acyl-phospholipid synthase